MRAAPASASSDRFGAFVVPAIGGAGPVRVEVSAFGYSVWAQTYEAVPSDLLRVLLAPAPFGLEALEAIAAGRAGDPLSISRDAFVIDSVVLREHPDDPGDGRVARDRGLALRVRVFGLRFGPVHPGAVRATVRRCCSTGCGSSTRITWGASSPRSTRKSWTARHF